MIRHTFFIFLMIASLLLAIPAQAKAPVELARIVAEYPHDSDTSTQGLIYRDGLFYETSGGWEISYIAIVDPASGNILKKQAVPARYFAEGLDMHADRLFMLTWQSGIGFTYALDSLDQLGSFAYRHGRDASEGWGLTNDGSHFIRSSGEARLYFHSLDNFTLTDSIDIKDKERLINRLNELEYVEGLVYANLWKEDTIAVIDPDTGQVMKYIDLKPLRKRLNKSSGVANGIAYDRVTQKLYVTGKHWNKLFEISIK
ncbi:glutaminyl-peptide cyclotransferase [Pseudodesulfovibrio sp. zrk46]|uniref:glutaminyl-peptide cyclotransferase n=1 Tax=Pseudodesulfovibrio sp. zrk46 TaxID=2725288 RepID=UPI0014490A9C|nr:glutaminyl-peptide cyclotransferase [Pseudodesulfovibrio sp. zrk46]QJB55255.1 glutaminyl-peptide cyclotransferase [Pseudodesulfovibrio sp. zrk46]